MPSSQNPPGIDLPLIPVELPCSVPSVLACGAWLKNTICLTRGRHAFVSPLIGDLDSAQARATLDETVFRMCQVLSVEPGMVAHDLHPDFYSTQFANSFAARLDLPVLAVQHHHAHIAAICAEHGVNDTVLGLAMDGVGLGTDLTPWGGELLLVGWRQFERVGHLSMLAMPGGDRAAREPWRMAASALYKMGLIDEISRRFHNQPAVQTVITMLQRGLNCPTTSSMGRLFDGAAGLLGVNEVQSHEAQAAIQLQLLAESYGDVPPLAAGYQITANHALDFTPLLAWLMQCSDVPYAAAVFHATLAEGLARWTTLAANQFNCARIALGGGCFHNALLLRLLKHRLLKDRLTVLTARQIPPNDSAISLGQAWVAAQHCTASAA